MSAGEPVGRRRDRRAEPGTRAQPGTRPEPATSDTSFPPQKARAGTPQLVLGGQPGQTRLLDETIAPRKRELVTGADVLPELSDAPDEVRRIWKHPAFIVSIITTFLAVATAVVLLVMGVFSSGIPRVSSIALTGGTGNLHLTWNGPDIPYSVYIVDGTDKATDISQLIRGQSVWLPRALGLASDDSCFVVRAASSTTQAEAVTLAADALDAQGAQSVCVAEATE